MFYVELHEPAGKAVADQFLRNLIAAVPYRIHTVLTDNGMQFTNRKQDRFAFEHIFSRVCRVHGIDRRLTKVNHLWTNGQVERMNRTIKEATVKRYHYDTHSQLDTHVTDFIAAYNYALRLKTLHGLTPFEYTCKIRTNEPDRFNVDPTHHTPGLNRPEKSHQHAQAVIRRQRRARKAAFYSVCSIAKIIAKAIHLVHPLVQDGHDANVAIRKPPPVHEMMCVPKVKAIDGELRRYWP